MVQGDVGGFCENGDLPRWVGSGQDRREGAAGERPNEDLGAQGGAPPSYRIN